MSVLWLKSGYTVKYTLSPREIPRAPPSGFPLCSGYISPYIPSLVIIQIKSITVHIFPNTLLYSAIIFLSLRFYRPGKKIFYYMTKVLVKIYLPQKNAEKCLIYWINTAKVLKLSSNCQKFHEKSVKTYDTTKLYQNSIKLGLHFNIDPN